MTLWRDSDAASFLSTDTDTLSSPSNGYFNNRTEQHPQDMYIDTDAANKGTRPKIAISSPRSTETSPLLEEFIGQAPPPSYLEATTPIPWNGRPSADEDARLLSFDGRRQPFDTEQGMFKGTSNQRRSFGDYCTRKRMLKWIGVILFLIIFAAIVAAITKSSSTPVTPIKTPAQPITSPLPQKGYPIRWPAQCGKKYNTNSEQFSYGAPPRFTVIENVHQADGPFRRISGWIHVAPAPSGQAAGTIQARLAYAVSESIDVNSIKFSSSSTGLSIGDTGAVDSFDGLQASSMACLGISVVIYMAAGTKLENFNVASAHLGMQIHPGVDLFVTNSTTISLTTGTLDAAVVNSREIHLETIAGSISGKYALRDLLSIKSESGSVNINVDPKEAVDGVSKTALFTVKSVAGSIRTDFERKQIPDRDYQVSIDTTVGSVDGNFIHGSKTDITTVAGGVTVNILPFKGGDYASSLTTSSDSGQMSITVESPYENSRSALSALVSSHKVISGALDLTYPQEWEGHLQGSSIDGVLHLQGRDLELIRQEEKPGMNRVEAKKGNGRSSISFSTISGGCEVKVGKL